MGESASDSTGHRVRVAYDEASELMMSDLLPRFCETEGFQRWLKQQQEQEQLEVEMLATLQAGQTLEAFKQWLHGKQETGIMGLLPSVAAGNEVCGRLLWSETWRLRFCQRNSMLTCAPPLTPCRPWCSQTPSGSLCELFLLFEQTSAYHGAVEALRQSSTQAPSLLHWLHVPDGFSSLRAHLAASCASEGIDFVSEVLKFKRHDEVSTIKETATRIRAKHLADGALAQVFVPATLITQVNHGLEPKFPSTKLFDECTEHVIDHMLLDVWPNFVESKAYTKAISKVVSSLETKIKAPFLVLRSPSSTKRSVTRLFKKVVTIGSANDCDVVMKEALAPHAFTLWADAQGSSWSISLLWGGSQDALATSDAFDGNTTLTAGATGAPRCYPMKYGASFHLGSLEAMILSARTI